MDFVIVFLSDLSVNVITVSSSIVSLGSVNITFLLVNQGIVSFLTVDHNLDSWQLLGSRRWCYDQFARLYATGISRLVAYSSHWDL